MIFAVDGGGTTFKTCLVDRDGILSDFESFPFDIKGATPALRASLDSIFQRRRQEMESAGTPIQAIGIGCRGIIDPQHTKLVDDSGMMNFFAGHSFRELFETDLPLGVENDAVAATLGENLFGMGRDLQNFLVLTLGTGIGGGIIIRNDIYTGHTGMGGHLGHFPVNPGGDTCGCGNVGCVETEFSAGAFNRRLADYNGTVEVTRRIEDVKELFDRAESGESGALDIVKRGVFYLARTISGYSNAFDPEKVILAGGIAQSGDFLMSLLIEELDDILWNKDPRDLLLYSTFGAQLGLYGAGAVGWRAVKS